MDRNALNKVGLAAVILLAPGGFILGATLAARYWQARRAEKAEAEKSAGTRTDDIGTT